MRYKINLPLSLTIILVLASMIKAAGQPVTDQFLCSRELTQLKRMFYDTSHVSFQAQHVITYNDGTKDTIQYQYKVSADKMRLESSDSTTIIQNEQCNLVANRAQRWLTVKLPVDVFQYVSWVRVSEPSFYKTLVKGMAVADTGGYRKLSYMFKVAAPYRTYDIIYDRTTHWIHSIQYSFSRDGVESSASSGRLPLYVTISFSDYQTGVFTDSVFSTDEYFIRKQGVYDMAAPYTSYQFTNLLNQ